MATILIVEDDTNTRLLTSARLKLNFTVLEAENGLQALDILYSQAVDLVIADVMMPVMDGFTMLKTLREDDNRIPVLLLTAKNAFDDKRSGFSSGTDDYLTKPVNYEELLWHIRALLRRANITADNRVSIGSVTMDVSSHIAECSGKNLALPRKEFDILFKLMSYPGQIFTKAQLLDDVWGYDSDSTEDTVKTHISRLRARIKHCDDVEITTIKGIGYRLDVRKGDS